MKITLIRHIKTTAPKGLCYGQTDVTLPLDFKNEHRKLADQLKNNTYDAIYASPLQRCALLAKEIAGEHPIIYDDRLKELNFGAWENKMWKDIEKLSESKAFFENYIQVSPPKGESFKQMIDRISGFIVDLKANHPKGNILIVSHGGPIRIFHGLSEELDPKSFFQREVSYGEISSLQI